MKRRSFVKSTLLTAAAGTVAPAVASAANSAVPPKGTDYYELRVYTLKNDEQQKLVEDFLQNAAIPAFNSMGVKHVGVFTELKPEEQTKLYVLIQYNGIAHFDHISDNINNDTAYKTKGAAYLTAPASQPAYERIESSLMKAFKHSPILAPPDKKTRIFELRQYQSATEAAGQKKIEMFNDQGEIDIFKRLGFNPVFWGETIIGPQRPNLTYMITFDDLAAKDAHWKAFGGDSQWKKISSVPEYADALLVNKITSTLLVPTAYSQI
ncbi:NIPSNAP family containing protein [Mucilaginibacter terrenus]|uniref:NIPSNAP family containing protein n=1 Tax=Mucilaginibacter terrenus TaxID=2482727 RepID=A0A3E2NXK7_9SPHI|nr:NIPSNAP family protein [Mucilaginibacter terrenus]RFZ85722.1 NIPSNAP family containing protein [Mucilaginibacter terrenus]